MNTYIQQNNQQDDQNITGGPGVGRPHTATGTAASESKEADKGMTDRGDGSRRRPKSSTGKEGKTTHNKERKNKEARKNTSAWDENALALAPEEEELDDASVGILQDDEFLDRDAVEGEEVDADMDYTRGLDKKDINEIKKQKREWLNNTASERKKRATIVQHAQISADNARFNKKKMTLKENQCRLV
jgi:hypothetical protein